MLAECGRLRLFVHIPRVGNFPRASYTQQPQLTHCGWNKETKEARRKPRIPNHGRPSRLLVSFEAPGVGDSHNFGNFLLLSIHMNIGCALLWSRAEAR